MGNTEKFDSIADSYDTANTIQLAKVSSKAIREYLIDAKNKDAMDFGCGTGLVGMDLINNFKSIIFIDTSQNMIDQVEQKIGELNVHNAKTLCFDFEKEPQSDLRVDYIFMTLVLLHIKDFDTVLSRLYKVLNKGGHLLIVDFDKNEKVSSDLVHNGFDQRELADTMAKIGFKSTESNTFYHGKNLFMGQDASMFICHSQK